MGIATLTDRFKNFPFFLVTLPLFFVLHGYRENYGFIDVRDVGILAAGYIIGTLLLFLTLFIIFRKTKPAAIATALLMVLFFFFSALHDFFTEHQTLKPFSKYSILLSVSVAGLLLLFIYFVQKQHTRQRFYFYLNLLMLLYIGLDIGALLVQAFGIIKKPSFSVEGMPFKSCDTCTKPTIYFLLFDEYASSVSLRERFDFKNDLDSFLLSEGFSIQTKSFGNYDFTPFSIASILNMSYIKGLDNPDAISVEDYSKSASLIRNAVLMDILSGQGYDIINYSIFDLKGHPAITEESMLPVKTKLITGRTLSSVLVKDIGWMRARYFPSFARDMMQVYRINNNKFIELVSQFAMADRKNPAFVYAHLEMPHPPYYYNKNGERRADSLLFMETKTELPAVYLDYLQYTNMEIRKLIRKIRVGDPSAVIVLMGDHGYRHLLSAKTRLNLLQNMNAVFIPAGKKIQLYDSISGVNQFRVLLNGLFDQQYSLLKDSGTLLKERVQ